MAYKELIKNFQHVRDYMRRFYIYGFKSRSEYDGKSGRSYDDERRRIESWLKDYMGFRNTDEGKNVFISIDSRRQPHNPLYKAMKARSFTDRDITLHFIIFDILYRPSDAFTLAELMDRINDIYLADFSQPVTFDESTLRKKLKEYIALGMVIAEKQGRNVLYRRSESYDLTGLADVLDYFSEIAPCGVIGSFMLDKTPPHRDNLTFKHHYITQAMDSQVLYRLFGAISRRRKVEITFTSRGSSRAHTGQVTPLKIFISCQNGRQYLMAADSKGIISAYRLDYILSVRETITDEDFAGLRTHLNEMEKYIWGANVRPDSKTEKVTFTVDFTEDEEFIWRRLVREKRCGTVTLISPGRAQFTATVYDSREMIPWIRSFICRISHIEFENKELQASFLQDIEDMYRMYGLEE